MIKTEEIKVIQYIETIKICDWCKKEVTKKDMINWQEFIHISEFGGYGSIFGDGNLIRLDICQQCLYDIFSSCIEENQKLEE